MSFTFENTPHSSLSCKLLPAQYREYEYDLLKTTFYYIKVSGIPSGKKLIKNDTISSHVKISMISLISSLSLKLYLNSLVYHRNIFGSSSHVLDNLRKPSDIFRDFRKMFGIVRLAFGTNLENLRKSSESDRRSLENHQNRHHEYVYIIKRTLHVSSKIWILLLLPLEHRIHIFSPPCNVLYECFMRVATASVLHFLFVSAGCSQARFGSRGHANSQEISGLTSPSHRF